MKKLLEYVLSGIADSGSFTAEESRENATINFNIIADPSVIGLIIGKNGRTIKAIQNVLRVRARLEKVSVFINVTEKSS